MSFSHLPREGDIFMISEGIILTHCIYSELNSYEDNGG